MKIFIALILSFQLVACNWYGDPPGEGVIAENYYKKSEPLIDALEKYYADNGKYPEKR